MSPHAAKSKSELLIPLTRPEVGLQELRAVARVLRSRWLTQGPEVEALEHEFACYVGASGSCAVSSCTAALHLALVALGVGPGDEVIVPSHTFIATVNAILYCGAKPRFADIAPETFCIDPGAIAAQITRRTACIIVVHQMGIPCDLRPIVELASRHQLPVVEDAACALGSEYSWNGYWEKIGKPHGDIACFSFHPRKVVSCGEGGVITCRDPQLLNKIRRLRQHGLVSLPKPNTSSPCYNHAKVRELGYNYRLSDIAAAIARSQLSRLPQFLQRRRELAARYHNALEAIPGCRVLHLPYSARPNYQSYPLRITESSPMSRDQLILSLAEAGIESKPGIMNVHQVATYLAQEETHLPHSEAACNHTILLPLYPSMSYSQQRRVIRHLTQLLTETAHAQVNINRA
ncbi:MAG: DegT/DnrJ/EryC1/StrS family aminotransferase [Gemmatales bacterium]|nr:DegT/DnrJ/EryC1/StrS family aminotransferase [Gemmatales bacterium]